MGIWLPSPTPVGMESPSIFFGSVDRNDVVAVTLNAWDFTETPVDTSPFLGSQLAYEYENPQVIHFNLNSSFYNDTNFDPYILRPTTFNLETAMGSSDYSDFTSAQFATITVHFDADYVGANWPVVRLFDWFDSDSNGTLEYWNPATGTGDIVDHISRATNPCNSLIMRIGSPTTLATLFDDGVAALQLDAPEAGTYVNVTIELWEPVVHNEIVVADGSTNNMSVTLTVPSDAEFGVHQGYILFSHTNGWSEKVPYSYMVDFTMDGSNYGGNQTLVDGSTDTTVTPYDTATAEACFVQGSTRTDESGGIDVFRVNIPYDITVNASIVVIRASWTNPGTVIDFQVRNLLNGLEATTNDRPSSGDPFDPQPTGTMSNTIVWDYGDLVNGSWWFLVYTHVFDGIDAREDIKITFQLYNATTFAAPTYVNQWESATSSLAGFSADDNLVGDHVVISNNWTLPAVAGLPEYHITGTRIALLSGLYEVMTGTYPDPQGVDAWPVPFDGATIYNWETVEGITAGDNVRVAIDAQAAQDPAFDVWAWNDENDDGIVDEASELSSTSLLSVDNGGSGTPEAGAYTAAESGSIAIRVYAFAYAYVAGAH
jgi:hypothetical protein